LGIETGGKTEPFLPARKSTGDNDPSFAPLQTYFVNIQASPIFFSRSQPFLCEHPSQNPLQVTLLQGMVSELRISGIELANH
jgi:hypothetical protein